MSSLSLPPLNSESVLTPILTRQALGDAAVEFAICELWASEDQVPLEALAVIQREPAESARLLIRKMSDTFTKYKHLEIPFHRGFSNCLIVLATLRQPESAQQILNFLLTSHAEQFVDCCSELIHKALGETIPDLASWTDLMDRYRGHKGLKSAHVIALIESLPYVVSRTSTSRSDAAQSLIRFFNSTSGDLTVESAVPTVQTLMYLVVPETFPDALRINQQGEPAKRFEVRKIRSVFQASEAARSEILAETEEERLSDAVKCFRYGPVYPSWKAAPSNIEEAIILLQEDPGDTEGLITANRNLSREPDKAVPTLLGFILSRIRTEPVDKNDDYYCEGISNQYEEHEFGAGYAVRLLMQFGCPEILPLLLPAYEAYGYDGFPGFEEIVQPVLQNIAAQTAPSPEFLSDWIQRLIQSPQITKPLVAALPSMVFEGRADRLQTISILRELYASWIASVDEFLCKELTEVALEGLLALGDVDFFRTVNQAKHLHRGPLLLNLARMSEHEELQVVISRESDKYAREWLLESRLFTANQKLYDDLATIFSSESGSEGWDEIEGKHPKAADQAFFRQMSGTGLPRRDEPNHDPTSAIDSPDSFAVSPGTIRNPAKIGRNDPCPCGSGRKYKKCCGN
jgi:hypothetical protein